MTQKISIDTSAVMALAKVIEETGLTEIEYEMDGARIRVAKTAGVVSIAPPAPISQSSSDTPNPIPVLGSDGAIRHTKDWDTHPGAVKSPMVGTAYASPGPGAAAFVNVGDVVTAGQTIMIIEAMKVMNPIKSPKAGQVAHILVNDSEPVEFGEVLLILE